MTNYLKYVIMAFSLVALSSVQAKTHTSRDKEKSLRIEHKKHKHKNKSETRVCGKNGTLVENMAVSLTHKHGIKTTTHNGYICATFYYDGNSQNVTTDSTNGGVNNHGNTTQAITALSPALMQAIVAEFGPESAYAQNSSNSALDLSWLQCADLQAILNIASAELSALFDTSDSPVDGSA